MSDSNKSTEIVSNPGFNIKKVIGKLLAYLPFVLFEIFFSVKKSLSFIKLVIHLM